MTTHEVKTVTPKNEQEALAAFRHPEFVECGVENLAYYRFGSGPDVVLIHGWPLHSATFRGIVPALAKSFTLHLFDLPGVGNSEARRTVSFSSHAHAVRRAIDALDLGDYALLAHDSGGVVARLIAADDARVLGLVIGGSEIPGHRPAFFETYARLSRVPGFATALLTALRIGVLRRSVLGFGGCFTDARYVDGAFGELFVRPLLANSRAADGHLALLRTLDFRFIDELRSVHARTQAPTLCVWGTDDPFFPLEKARAMLPEFGGDATLIEIANAKLFAHEDHPEEFVAAALPFLERCLAKSHALRAMA